MSLAEEWLEIVRKVVLTPSEFFEEETRKDGFGFPLKFAALSLLVTGVINAVRTGFDSMVFGTPEIVASVPVSALVVASFIWAILGGLLFLFIGAAIYHIFVALLGGERGYSQTVAVLAYATALSPVAALVSFVPILGTLIGAILFFYGLYINIRGIENFHSMSTGRAAAAVATPWIVILVLTFLTILVVGIAAFTAVMGAGGPEALGP